MTATRLGPLVLRLLAQHPDAAARELERCGSAEAAAVLGAAPPDEAARVVSHLTPDAGVRILTAADDAALARVLPHIDAARSGALLARVPDPERERWLDAAGPRLGPEMAAISHYASDTAGGNMDARVMTGRADTPVAEALTLLEDYRDRKVRRVFVIDDEGKLVGSVELQVLAVAPRDAPLGSLMTSPAVSVAATAGLPEVVEVASRTDRGTLAVVDFEGRLIGVLRHDALLDVARRDVMSNLQSMVGASREERALSPVMFAVRKRLPWLQINLATAFLASAVVGLFEDTIARNTALAVLLPVVAGQSGNTGAQALAVTMRGLSLREVRTGHLARVSFKEVRVGFLNGIAVAATTSLAVYLWSGSSGLALVIGVSMVLSMTAAGLAGAMVPMVLTTLGLDPAQSSSIVLTTVTDIAGFFSFLGIAALLSSLM